MFPSGWSADGELVFSQLEAGWDVGLLPLEGDRTPSVLLAEQLYGT